MGVSILNQASPTHPGTLEQINSDGSRISGQFKNGKFITADGQGNAFPRRSVGTRKFAPIGQAIMQTVSGVSKRPRAVYLAR